MEINVAGVGGFVGPGPRGVWLPHQPAVGLRRGGGGEGGILKKKKFQKVIHWATAHHTHGEASPLWRGGEGAALGWGRVPHIHDEYVPQTPRPMLVPHHPPTRGRMSPITAHTAQTAHSRADVGVGGVYSAAPCVTTLRAARCNFRPPAWRHFHLGWRRFEEQKKGDPEAASSLPLCAVCAGSYFIGRLNAASAIPFTSTFWLAFLLSSIAASALAAKSASISARIVA